MAWADKFKEMLNPEKTKLEKTPVSYMAPKPIEEKEISVIKDSTEKKKQDNSNRKRSVAMTIRMTPEEAEEINLKVKNSGKSKTDFLLTALKNTPVVVIDDVPKLIIELRKQGNNLNQAVKLAHQMQNTNIPELEKALQDCMDSKKAILEFCKKWDVQLSKRGVNNGNFHNDSE